MSFNKGGGYGKKFYPMPVYSEEKTRNFYIHMIFTKIIDNISIDDNKFISLVSMVEQLMRSGKMLEKTKDEKTYDEKMEEHKKDILKEYVGDSNEDKQRRRLNLAQMKFAELFGVVLEKAPADVEGMIDSSQRESTEENSQETSDSAFQVVDE